MRISDWISDVCSSDLIGQDYSDAVNHGSGRAAGYNMGVRDDVAVRGYDEAGAQRLRFTGLRLSRKAKQAAERRSGEGILALNMLAAGNIEHCGLKPLHHVGNTGRSDARRVEYG